MSDSMEIQCVEKSGRRDAYERISAIGGVTEAGEPWKLPAGVALDGIKNGRYRFFIKLGDREVDVIIARSPGGQEYLKTHADGEEPDTLLRLPACPK
jgi:hypothetical protein